MNTPAVSLAKMQRMKRAIEREGLPFAGFMTRPDGSVLALVGDPLTAPEPEPPVAAEDDDGSWEAYDKRHGHG